MIILSAADAAKVRGVSPTNSQAALDPMPLRDGTFYLPDEVLNDPAHTDVAAILTAAAKATPAKVNLYNSLTGSETMDQAQTKVASDRAEVTALGLPSYTSVGVRKS
jgi:hypothetical protein